VLWDEEEEVLRKEPEVEGLERYELVAGDGARLDDWEYPP